MRHLVLLERFFLGESLLALGALIGKTLLDVI